MRKIELSRFAPPGTDTKKEVKNLCIGLTGAALCAMLIYGVQLRNAYEMLFDRVGEELVLRPGAVMWPFREVLGYALWFFYFVAACTLASAALHHLSYYMDGSKSIYVMRRLPQRWEWLKRDIALPVTGAVCCLLAALLLRLLFLGVYYWVTPAQCFP